MPRRELVGTNAPSAADALDGTEVLHVVQVGNSRVATTQEVADLALAAAQASSEAYADALTPADIGASPVTAISTHTTATLTLTSAHDQAHIIADMVAIGAGLAVSIPNTLTPGFGCTLRKSGAANAITFASGAGLITPTFRGQATITADDTDVFVFVESSTKAMAYVVEPA